MENALAAQRSLTNFYESVQFRNPALAMRMSDDIRKVALYGVGGDRRKAYDAVISLRELSAVLPRVFTLVLDRALEDLGYSLLDVEHYRRVELA